jgi:hypothetical protein
LRHAIVLLALLSIPAPAGGGPTGSAAPREVDIPGFLELVDRIVTGLRRVDHDQFALTSLLTVIPSRLRVNGGGQTFDVSLEPVAQLIAAAKEDPARWLERRQAIERQLFIIRAEAVSLAEHSTTKDVGVDPHVALTAILKRKEFARAASAEWTTRLRQRITNWLLDLWDRVGANRFGSQNAARWLVWIATLAAVAGVAFWFHRKARRRRAAAQAAAAARTVTTPARALAQQALIAIAEGRASEAVRLAYRAGLARLAEAGVWNIDEARTAREYVRLLTGVEARDGAFRNLAFEFERVVYANREATAGDLARLADQLETLGCLRPHERAI